MGGGKVFLRLTCSSLFLALLSSTSLAADSISANESLSGDTTLVSSGGNFELGFFSPGKSSKFYICIWYKKVSERTVVWVANRETPISDRYSSILKIQDGNLVILNESRNVVWSTNLNSGASISAKAVLLDSGNFVLRDDGSNKIWQSLDNPTHTWLPGGKIRLNKITGRSQLLTSWKNSEDPSPGLFSLELDPNGTRQYFILWNLSRVYWTSGTWNGHTFSLVPEMSLNYLYNFSFVPNENDSSYFTYSLYDESVISRFVMDVSGQIKQFTWLKNTQQWNQFWSKPTRQCDVYAYCGAYGSCNENARPFCNCLHGFQPKLRDWNLSDYSGGCVRIAPLHCSGGGGGGGGGGDRFFSNPSMRLPDSPHTVRAETDRECEKFCLRNCSCTAYAFNTSGCSIWIGDLFNVQKLSPGDPKATTLYIRLSASEFSDPKNKTGVIVGVIVGVFFVGGFLLGFLIFALIRRRRMAELKTVEGSLLAFKYRDLQSATKNFSEKLGEGGFGSVFKGILPDSTPVAVKKLASITQGDKQFRTEVRTIGTIQHVNLVRLLGFCSDNTKRLLVYDYMQNGSLDKHLFSHGALDWRRRYQIALGIARGLNYLHHDCRDCIIHCDIKPENILLDAEFHPKVADFGLAKLLGREFSRVLTTMRGTRGYLAPEWISGVTITAKADVYSYGMLLFELISGRRNSELSANGRVNFFPTLAASVLLSDGDIFSLLDEKLAGNAAMDELLRLCRLACWCIQDEEADRPTMGHVVQIFEGGSDVPLPPLPKSLQVYLESPDDIVFFIESSSRSRSKTLSKPSFTSSSSS